MKRSIPLCSRVATESDSAAAAGADRAAMLVGVRLAVAFAADGERPVERPGASGHPSIGPTFLGLAVQL